MHDCEDMHEDSAHEDHKLVSLPEAGSAFGRVAKRKGDPALWSGGGFSITERFDDRYAELGAEREFERYRHAHIELQRASTHSQFSSTSVR